MILASLTDFITVPFGWLLAQLYNLIGNYGVAMILFAIIVQLVLLPITAKSKKSMMKMSRLQPRIQEIQKKYANDQQKQNEAIQQLQKDEGVGMGCGGCLWSFVPLLILWPLLAVVRSPIEYLLGQTPEVAQQIIDVIKTAAPNLFSSNDYYNQVIAAQAIPEFAEQIKAAIPGISAEVLEGINFSFLGLNLGSQPQFNVFNAELWAWDWAHIGLFLIPVISAGSQMLQMLISQKMNNSVITNDKGIQDEEAAKNSQAAQSTKMMMWTMPLMSLWIGFTVPASLSLYWLVGGIVRTIEDCILTRHYRKVYDAEDAIKLQKTLELEAAEAEKERIRAEKRAANPDGITENTSKKKLQQKQRAEQQAAKEAAAKEYAAKKGLTVEEESHDDCLSGVPERPYCKGRAYNPNRYGSKSTEE